MLRKAPWILSVGVLGLGIFLVLFGSASASSSAPPPDFTVSGTVTANQGTAGTHPWPVSGTVSGTVDVTSLPSLPAGTNHIGQVGVDNFPSTQPVSGSVGVNNFPSTQPVSGSVGVNNFPSTQPVSGSVGVNNFPSTQQVSGTVTANQGTNPWVVTEAEPNAMFDSGSVPFDSNLSTQVAEPATGQDLIIESVHVSALCGSTIQCEVVLILGQPNGASTCTTSNEILDDVLIQPSETLSGSPPQVVSQPSQTLYVLPYSPGLLIPNGCALSAIGLDLSSGSFPSTVSATGYEVSA